MQFPVSFVHMKTPSPSPSPSPSPADQEDERVAAAEPCAALAQVPCSSAPSSFAASSPPSAEPASPSSSSHPDSCHTSQPQQPNPHRDPQLVHPPRPGLCNPKSDSEIQDTNPIPDSEIQDSDPSLYTGPTGKDVEDQGEPSPCQENSKPKRLSFSLWNAVVREPMRRLQEHFLGSRWIPAAEASKGSSIWLLGIFYSLSEDGPSSSSEGDAASVADFCNDYSSRIWLTYRKGFEALGLVQATSDVGWGCMLRSGQMLLAQALVCHYLGRDWRRNPSEPNAREYLNILQCFGDAPSEDCPFSIHNILEAGGPYGLVGGSWLGPYALCRTFEALARSLREKSKNNDLECKLPMEVYVVSGDADGERGGAPCICIDDVERLCSKPSAQDLDSDWTPVLLLVPLVLGLDKVNSRYLPSIWATFTFPQSTGIMGGKRGASTYIVGVQDDQALYLDPHEVQQVVLVSPNDMEVDTSSYHCSVVRKMPLNAIDPSLALGFYCRGRADFVDLCARASDLARESSGAPMFTVVENNNARSDSLPAEIGTPPEQGPSEEDWQIL